MKKLKKTLHELHALHDDHHLLYPSEHGRYYHEFGTLTIYYTQCYYLQNMIRAGFEGLHSLLFPVKENKG